jgi:hypothetical protein
MMNEPGKSDRPAVPEKSPNNAGPPAAEGMEGRGLAKGNPPQVIPSGCSLGAQPIGTQKRPNHGFPSHN